MAESTSHSLVSQEVQNVGPELLNRISELVQEGETVWDKLLNEQALCTQLIAEQVLVNDKFAEYHDIWADNPLNYNEIMTFHQFNEIDEEVSGLSDWMQNIEFRVQQAMEAIRNLLEMYTEKISILRKLPEEISQAREPNDLEGINARLQNFQWFQLASIPNISTLMDEWRAKGMDQRIIHCILQMTQLIHTQQQQEDPEVESLSPPQPITTSSSSSSEAINGSPGQMDQD